jgi:hypothetical protein
MALPFFADFPASRLAPYEPQSPLRNVPSEQSPDAPAFVDLRVEVDRPEAWAPIPVDGEKRWQPQRWPERPRRFIDGKDVGRTVTWVTAPGGYPVPIRLSQIGGIELCVEDGAAHRGAVAVESIVSLVADPFPPEQMARLADDLGRQRFRLVRAPKPEDGLTWDFETMRAAAQTRSSTEMGLLEEQVLGRHTDVPSVVDGRLETRSGAGIRDAPVAGVVKTHVTNYLHSHGLQVMHALNPGERTPVFALRARTGAAANEPQSVKFEVASWYLRLTGAGGAMPSWGVVRVELPWRFYEGLPDRECYVTRLSRLLYDYRSRDSGYDRVAVSLHPIVRAEQLLGALFAPMTTLTSRFYRVAGI